MYKIACNWSDPLADLIINRQINIDYIKAGAYGEFERQFDTIRSLKPILLHGLGYHERTGMENINLIDLQRANKIIKDCGCPHLGIHLAIKNSDMQSLMEPEDIYIRMSKHIQFFKKNLSVPVLLENIPDSPQERAVFDHYPYAEPERINRLLYDNDVNLLLDLAHAKVTALYKDWKIYEYLKNLPLDRIKEIHVSGSGYDQYGFPDDTHQAMCDDDYELLYWVLERSNPDIVTLEYVGIDSEPQDLILDNLYSQIKKLEFICR